MFAKKWLALAIALMIPVSAMAAGIGQNTNPISPYLNITGTNQIDGVTINPNQPLVFSATISGNPLVQDSYTDVPTDVIVSGLTSSAYTTLIASATGRKIIPTGGITLMASGTAATATAIALECSDFRLIAQWPVADLVNNVPSTLIGSSAAGTTLSSALSNGCASGTALYISNVGTNLTTTTHLYVNLPYTFQ